MPFGNRLSVASCRAEPVRLTDPLQSLQQEGTAFYPEPFRCGSLELPHRHTVDGYLDHHPGIVLKLFQETGQIFSDLANRNPTERFHHDDPTNQIRYKA